MLILLSLMCRISELTGLDLDKMTINEGSISFTLPVPTKTFSTKACSYTNQGLQHLTLKKFADSRICPVSALYAYLKRNLHNRNNASHIFISLAETP